MPVDLPKSVSINGAEINLTVQAVSTGFLCCNLAESKSVLKMYISKPRAHSLLCQNIVMK